tara:strand:- start:394 stop:1260 length:867 start_codon:yes stop_codon:yes gene_type:complete
MRIRFIINPVSGTGKQQGIENHINNHIKHDFEIVYTKSAGDATMLSKSAISDGFDIVVAVGGDGTVNECVKSLIKSNTALGVIPCGSGNGFAYHLGMRRDPKEAIKQLNNIFIEEIDLCTANGIPFVNVSGVGFDAHIAKLFSGLKVRGFMNYLKLILKELNYKAKEYEINYDGRNKKVEAFLISFANASQYGNDAKISPIADIKDGLLDFVIVKRFPKWKIPLFLFKVAIGKVHLSKYVEIIQTEYMKINTTDTLVHLDGEPLITTNPLHIKLLPKTLKIAMPYGGK